MAYLNGRVGQVLGPFDSTNLLSDGGAIDVFTPETSSPFLTKLGIQASSGTIVSINGAEIKIGKTGIYELDNDVTVYELSFPNGADDSTIVDFIY
jgi:hypothetical protein